VYGYTRRFKYSEEHVILSAFNHTVIHREHDLVWVISDILQFPANVTVDEIFHWQQCVQQEGGYSHALSADLIAGDVSVAVKALGEDMISDMKG